MTRNAQVRRHIRTWRNSPGFRVGFSNMLSELAARNWGGARQFVLFTFQFSGAARAAYTFHQSMSRGRSELGAARGRAGSQVLVTGKHRRDARANTWKVPRWSTTRRTAPHRDDAPPSAPTRGSEPVAGKIHSGDECATFRCCSSHRAIEQRGDPSMGWKCPRREDMSVRQLTDRSHVGRTRGRDFISKTLHLAESMSAPGRPGADFRSIPPRQAFAAYATDPGAPGISRAKASTP